MDIRSSSFLIFCFNLVCSNKIHFWEFENGGEKCLLLKKSSFPLRISSVSVTKSAASCGRLSHLLKESLIKIIFCAVVAKNDCSERYGKIPTKILENFLLQLYNKTPVNKQIILLLHLTDYKIKLFFCFRPSIST